MHLALILEGGGASEQCAALRIPALALAEMGATVRTVPYPAWRPAIADAAQVSGSCAEVAETLSELVTDGGWRQITFIAKSLGTLVLAELGPARLTQRQVAALWLTPLYGPTWLRDVVAKAVAWSGDRR